MKKSARALERERRDKNVPRFPSFLGFAVLFFVFSSFLSGALACDTPVYRYALERWESAKFPLYVFHGKNFDGRYRSWVDAVRRTNARVRVADVTARPFVEGAEVYGLYAKGEPMPNAVLFPEESVRWIAGGRRSVNEGRGGGPLLAVLSLAEPLMASLPDSPARQKVVAHILDGGVAAWVVVKGGDEKVDGEFLDKLEGLLAKAQKEVVAPEVVAGRISPLWGDAPSFLVVPVDRKDAAEAFFLWQLLGGELGEGNEPLVFPVYGRGRVLPPVGASLLNQGRVDWLASFLVGPCSCEVKEENPGRDLIFPDRWEEGIRNPSREKNPLGAAVLPVFSREKGTASSRKSTQIRIKSI